MKDIIKVRKTKLGDEKLLAHIQTESWKAAFNKILSKEDLDKYTDVNEAEKLYKEVLESGYGQGSLLEINGEGHSIA